MNTVEMKTINKADLLEKIVAREACEIELMNYLGLFSHPIDALYDLVCNIYLPSEEFGLSQEDMDYFSYLFDIAATESTQEEANLAKEFYFIYINKLNKDLVVINEKILAMENLNYEDVENRSNVKRLFLTFYLNLILSNIPLDIAKMREIKDMLSICIEASEN